MSNINEFIKYCLIHKQAHVNNDEILAEKNTEDLMKIRKKLHLEGDISKLSELFNHQEDWIRYHAAFWLLPVKEKESILVLKDLKKSKDTTLKDMVDFALEYWKKGYLNWLNKY